jgi:hypothetical protein
VSGKPDCVALRPLPVTHLLLLGAGIPIAATVSGWLLGGREPRDFTRRLLD